MLGGEEEFAGGGAGFEEAVSVSGLGESKLRSDANVKLIVSNPVEEVTGAAF